ncbi:MULTISPECIES: hypothetical protein [Flavobacterium]|uniref:Uncharacterized protein n=1 Tax=Flavobacterium jumunjinense TaxID=998845 RepID=A0ABV5GLB3_9FLAO|nr:MULTISPECIES: hypothetical protein [Flavobacterium]
MNTFKQYIFNNKLPLLVVVFVIATYLFSTMSGNRICNCEKIEKEKRTRSSRIYNSNSYNHK